MLEIDFNLFIDKEDLKPIFQIFKKHNPSYAVYFIDLGNYVQIEFTSDYEEYELVKDIENLFSEYEFINDLTIGHSEVKLIIHRSQSPFSTDGWGRRIEDPLDEKLYLVRRNNEENNSKKNFNPEIIVFHNNEANSYFINIVQGVKGEEKGFLVLKDFENNQYGKKDKIDFFNRLNTRLSESFSYGILELKNYVSDKMKMTKRKRKKK